MVQDHIKEVRGLAYFGSLTVGRERKGPSHPSDLDLVVFYDGSNLINQQLAIQYGKGHMVVNRSLREKIEQNTNQRAELVSRIE